MDHLAEQALLRYRCNGVLERLVMEGLREQQAHLEREIDRFTAKMELFEEQLEQIHARIKASPNLAHLWAASEVKKGDEGRNGGIETETITSIQEGKAEEKAVEKAMETAVEDLRKTVGELKVAEEPRDPDEKDNGAGFVIVGTEDLAS